MKLFASIIAILLLTSLSAVCQEHPHADSARAQARRLLSFHSENDERAGIDPKIRQLRSIRNPAGGRRLEVLEIWGFVYKAQYRMRLYYAKLLDGDYVLMGQEIVEYARL
jgi:hypothetical protein